MSRTSFVWMLYVTGYTALLGLPLLFFPNAVIPYLGFNSTDEPWVRLTGGLMLALSYITLTIYRKQITPMLIPSVHVRSGLILVLVALGAMGYPPFLFVMAGIVLVGVIGTLVSYKAGPPA
jgi:hypothetical protein